MDNVVLPVFRQLIDERFTYPQSRFLRKHILGKHYQNQFIPTEMKSHHGYAFEVLFSKWDLGMVSNKEYLVSLDALLTEFLLNRLKHPEGFKSASYYSILQKVAGSIAIVGPTYRSFRRAHELSRLALHRLEKPHAIDELYTVSSTLYSYFEYLDEFDDSQQLKTIVIRGKRYRRIKYGKEPDLRAIEVREPCGDCGVESGQYHVEGCDLEICPKCGGQLIGCRYKA